MLTSEIHDYAERSVLCWLATVDAAGWPSVSPKEIFAIFDDNHLVVANIASPKTARNIEHNERVCVSFVDVFVQKGFKITGTAKNVKKAEAEFSRWATPLEARASDRFPLLSVFVVKVIKVESIVAPSYRMYATETTEESQVASAMRTYGVQPARSDA